MAGVARALFGAAFSVATGQAGQVGHGRAIALGGHVQQPDVGRLGEGFGHDVADRIQAGQAQIPLHVEGQAVVQTPTGGTAGSAGLGAL